YMSPEQATGQPVAAATDVYALGAVAYFCLAGRPPFDGDNPLAVALRHAQDEPAPLPPDTPPAVAAVIARAMAKRPAERYASAAELAAAAADARDATLASIPPSARPPWAVAAPATPVVGATPPPALAPPALNATPALAPPVPGTAPALAPPASPVPISTPPVPTGVPTPQPVPPTDPAGPPAFRAGLAPIRQAETGPTREDPVPTSSHRRRGPLLVGVGAIVLIALVGGAV